MSLTPHVPQEESEYEATFGSYGKENGQFKEPKGIAIDSHNNVWVADADSSRVQEFNEKGEYEGAAYNPGTKDNKKRTSNLLFWEKRQRALGQGWKAAVLMENLGRA